ncbi:cyclic AMP-responsive element-binding protein 3-like protein 3-A [Cololabis saira]|uniref:cyclic AMP-responsive element-binding protein 3-like protein 3-A n=1 Tax=Cololabis saira TaxID=129043 RepID=UPI002AD5917E|nr:cyclic AMP-responsive element-binding protein 3-like protein 3-A [Cololabis saira]
MTTDKMQGGMDIFERILGDTEESISYHNNQSWTMTINDTTSPERSDADDFLDALLHDSAAAPASALWSPCTTDSGINEEPLTDSTERLYPATCTAFPAFDIQAYPQPPSLQSQSPASEKTDVSIDLGWDSGGLQDEFGIAYYLTTNQNAVLPSSHTLTVKDLLLSNLGQKARRIPQHSLQELNLNEDEKKLLAKEGINLPSKLPLSKFEERILKKIRRKIRNKRSAQESRKKKREYVDSLEERMSACNTQNLKLQRKIQQLEETNNTLLEQLNQLQALTPNSSCRTTNKRTYILVLLLSFSLLISSNIQPGPYSQHSRTDYAETRVSSRSLQSMDEEGGASPPHLQLSSISWGFEALRGLTGKVLAWGDLPVSLPQDDSQTDDYRSYLRRM